MRTGAPRRDNLYYAANLIGLAVIGYRLLGELLQFLLSSVLGANLADGKALPVAVGVLLNGLFAPDQGLFPTYAGGRYALGDNTLLVSRGLARESTRLPRFYNRPELVMVELRPGLEEFPAKKE